MTPNSYTIDAPLGADIRRYERLSMIVGVAGLLVCVLGFFIAGVQQFLRSYLIGFFFWNGMALGCMGILMVHYVAGGAWGMVMRRPLEAGTRTLKWMALLALPLIIGVRQLYLWAEPGITAHDKAIQDKSLYLNLPFWTVRLVLYFAIWLLIIGLLNKWSLEQDRNGDEIYAKKLETLSAPGLVIYAFTITFAAVDLLMSLDPHWYSTVYGLLVMVGQGLSAFAFIIAVLILLSGHPPMSEVITKRHMHDLGKLMLAFVMLWAYLSFSQLIIIWSGNLPEEITWYRNRLNGGWQWVGLGLLLFHFVVPFLMLLSQDLKKNRRMLSFVAIWVIVIRVVDVFWLVEPNFHGSDLQIHWLDLAAPIGIGGIWLALFFWNLRQRPLMPANAPDLLKAIDHGRHH